MSKISYFGVFVWISLLSLLFSSNLKAQNPSSYYEENPRTFYGGLILGGNFSQVDGDNYAGYHKVGLNGGGIVYANLANHFAASMEILYSQKGSKSNGVSAITTNGSTYDVQKYNINLNYAEVPLQLNYFDRRKSHFGGGFSISQIISSKETVETNPAFPNPDTLNNFKFKKTDLNFILGGSMHIWQGFFLNLRFQYSILPIRKNQDIYPGLRPGGRDQFNNLWTLRVMYLF